MVLVIAEGCCQVSGMGTGATVGVAKAQALILPNLLSISIFVKKEPRVAGSSSELLTEAKSKLGEH